MAERDRHLKGWVNLSMGAGLTMLCVMIHSSLRENRNESLVLSFIVASRRRCPLRDSSGKGPAPPIVDLLGLLDGACEQVGFGSHEET